MGNLLVRYIRLAVDEARSARVPQQLVTADSEKNSGKNDDSQEADQGVNEFSGVGSIAGYSAPLGMDPDRLGRKNNKRKK